MFSRIALAVTLVTGLLGAESAVHAQAASRKAATAARAHYEKGMKAYDLGRFDEAVSEFASAYEVQDDPAYLFNSAQAHRRGGNDRKALELYRTYLRKSPDATDRAGVEAIMAELERKLAPAPVPAPAPAPTVAPGAPVVAPSVATLAPTSSRLGEMTAGVEDQPATRPGRTLRIAAIASGVVGLAAVGGGVACLLVARSRDEEAVRLPVYDAAREQSLKSDASTARTAGYVALGVGGAAVVTGAVLAIVGWHADAPGTISLQPVLGPRMAGLLVQQAF
jgi:tetratricopeptide (TPR) repeat protein